MGLRKGSAITHRHGMINESRQFRRVRLQHGRHFASSIFGGGIRSLVAGNKSDDSMEKIVERMGVSLQEPAGPLYGNVLEEDHVTFIPQVRLHEGDGRHNKRVLMLCTGGTLTMARDPAQGGALAPVEGSLSSFMQEMNELRAENMPDGTN
jgi:hypothetical protein